MLSCSTRDIDNVPGERPSMDNLLNSSKEELVARIESAEAEIHSVKDRLDSLEAGFPYINPRRSFLNTLVFIVWLILPVGVAYVIGQKKR